MKSFEDALVHKTVSELFDMVKSKQAEVDELRKRIDGALTMLGHGNGYGYEQCSRLAINILKGEQS